MATWWKIENIERGESYISLITDRQNKILFDVTYFLNNTGAIYMYKEGRVVEPIRFQSLKDLLERTKLIFKREEQLQIHQEILKRI